MRSEFLEPRKDDADAERDNSETDADRKDRNSRRRLQLLNGVVDTVGMKHRRYEVVLGRDFADVNHRQDKIPDDGRRYRYENPQEFVKLVDDRLLSLKAPYDIAAR
jgi:hypothetical protein